MSAVCLCSKQDIAAQTIREQLLTLFPFKQTTHTYDAESIYQFENLRLVTIDTDSIYADHLEKELKSDLFIFASRHKSAAFKPALLTHIPGNWATAELGGKPSTLCHASSAAMKIALRTLIDEQKRLGLEDWACGLEATHHGPYIEHTPVLFIEIGSTEKEWRNETAAEIVARSIIAVAKNFETQYPTVLGFGGPHYCPSFTRLCAETEYAISHILPKYHLKHVSTSLIRHAIERTSTPVHYAALDWKGMSGSDRTRIFEALEEVNLEGMRVRDLLRSSKSST